MLYELHTYTLKPGATAIFEAEFARDLPVRETYSLMAGFWHTEIGPLNQVVHLWPYNDLTHKQEVYNALTEDERVQLPASVRELVLEMESEILVPAPFMRPIVRPQALGSVYELRIYTYQPESMQNVLAQWAAAIVDREKRSPLAGCWHSQVGVLNRFFHLWAYKDLNDRSIVRDAANEDPNWPPGTRQWMLRQESKILIPATFSQMH